MEIELVMTYIDTDIGHDETNGDSIQYELIDKQFDCMAKYLSWDMLFNKSYYATARDELEKNKNSMNELEEIGKNL